MSPDQISLVLSLISIATVIWKAATVNAEIRSSIKDVRDDLVYKYDLELEKIRSKLQETEYLNNANKELINHRSLRFEAEINNIKAYLQKKFDFQFRRFRPYENEDDDGPRSGPL